MAHDENPRPRPVSLTAEESKSFARVNQALREDLRFEHLEHKTNDVVWSFVNACLGERRTDEVAAFVASHARKPMVLVCYLPIESLRVEAETRMLGIRLLPLNDPRIPIADLALSLLDPVGCVATVEERGTSYRRMHERARSSASHALRNLRVALREHRGINDWQLRFRLADYHAFSNGASGWSARSDSALELVLDPALIQLAVSQPVASLPLEPITDIDRKADLAMRWLERARFAGEPIEALLYLFFGLEALLGDTSEGLKGQALAFRQAMLSHVASQGFADPNTTYFLYDEVRSGAVHGERVPVVSWNVVDDFASTARNTLNDYLEYAKAEALSSRAGLVGLLDEHPDRPKLAAWLRARGGKKWEPYLAKLDQLRP